VLLGKAPEARVTLQDEWKSTLHAKVGIESKDGSTEFITKQFKLQQEDGYGRYPCPT
jgi:hypothetical protein